KQNLQKPFANEVVVKRMVYDFSQDGGAQTDTYLLGEFDDDMVVLQSFTNIRENFAGASSTYKIGIGSDDDAVLGSTAMASMTAGVLAGAAASVGLLAAAGDKVVLTIGAAACTAGKLEVVLICVAR